MAKTFLITGVSSGFGRALAEAALNDGHRVIGTVRNEPDQQKFEALGKDAHALILDVTDTQAIAPAVAEVEKTIGAIDVLVNNAGYGHEGILEESSIDDLRRQFEVNVFGAVAMIQAVLPFMRKRRAGHILNITSMGGIITLPGLSYYHGSKFALEGISESLGKEVRGSRHQGHRDRAGRLPHRLGGPVDGARGAIDRRLRRDHRADPQASHGIERLAGRRSQKGRAGDAESGALGRSTRASACSAAMPCGWWMKK